ncbi:TetR/AcrR family transcriptional regulator [Phaeobacter sp.]|uniref:TetR/AcrR family transcriptional regulator n=1 Tax=Phaeobacter sp. TaxID=1902409 RepID=UPI0025DFE05E|nr:TetR/AcrR family transcriptional regulator [Phaeobacter sp.]
MTDTKDKIASSLHHQFAEHGFATLGVEALRAGADVSLRTLYKHFPSREEMVVGALEHRDGLYREWISGGPGEGAAHVLHPFMRLADWLRDVANLGCLSRYALASYPDSPLIRGTVEAQKRAVREMFHARLLHVAPECDADLLADALFLMHEGLTESARLMGQEAAVAATLHSAKALLRNNGIN